MDEGRAETQRVDGASVAPAYSPIWQHVTLLAILIWIAAYTIYFLVTYHDALLLDHYPFRQTQTASAAREIAEGGPWINYRLPVFGPPWTVPMEFPVYQIVVAKLSGILGWSIDPTARLVNGVSMFGILCLTWRLASLLGQSARTQFLVVLMTAFSPMLFYWSFSTMIEVFAVFLCLAFTVSALEYLKRGEVWPLCYGLIFAVLAALAKSTTFAVFAIFVFSLFVVDFLKAVSDQWKSPGRLLEYGLKHLAYGIVLFVPALFAALLWIHHSDSVKELSPLTKFVTSESLTRWNYGSDVERGMNLKFMFNNFRVHAPSIFGQTLGTFWVIPFATAIAGFCLAPTKGLPIAIVLVVSFLAGPMIFSNLYAVHYYYWVAVGLFAVLLAAIGTGLFLDRLDQWKLTTAKRFTGFGLPLSLPACAVITSACLLGWMLTFNQFFYKKTAEQNPDIAEVGRNARILAAPDEVVFIFGYGWNPAIQYYSQRDAFMVMEQWPERALDYAKDKEVTPGILVFCGNSRAAAANQMKYGLLASTRWTLSRSTESCDLYDK